MQSESSGTVFHCKTSVDTSRSQRVPAMVALGLILGGVGWHSMDGTLTLMHMSAWLVPGVVLIVALVWFFERNPVLSIGIDDSGLTITRAGGTKRFLWAEVEAARFQDYPVAHSGGRTITVLLIRTGGKTLELTPDFPDDAARQLFEEAILCELESRDIPETSSALPSFEHVLSLCGAWTFIVSIVGLLGANLAGYHTLGTIFGLAFLFTGSVIAWMTRRQRLSKLIIAATALVILGGSVILWVCRVNVRQVLQKWEHMEKR